MIVFLTGGARSGKSRMAIEMASRAGAPVRLVATARAEDEEMRRRIEQHRRHRPDDWSVVEEPVDLTEALSSAGPGETVVVDCVTLWISNLMFDRDDSTIRLMVDDAVVATTDRSGTTIVVSNEVGSGIVPMDPIGRRFRDLHGWANQRFASAADEAFLVVAGKALRLE